MWLLYLKERILATLITVKRSDIGDWKGCLLCFCEKPVNKDITANFRSYMPA